MDAIRIPISRAVPQDRWATLARTTGVMGLASVAVIFTAIIAISTVGEPPLEASSQDAAEFFRSSQPAWVQAAGATVGLGMVALLWFVVGLSLILGRAEGEPPWRSGVVLVSGVVLAAYGVLDSSWDAAAHRADEIGPALAGYAFSVGNIGFANAWLAMASLAVAAGWVILGAGVLARWTGWCALVSGAGLVVARYLWWVEGVWFLPYALFWVWMVATCVRLVRRPHDLMRPAGT
jgi:hypothetical protein